jgi:uncharacterized cupredoxin-like copper-binding protein
MRKAILGAALLLPLAGCGGGGSSSVAKTQTEANTAAPLATITVTETDFSIAPATINVPRAGTYVLKAVNKGRVTHALEVEGNGVSAETSGIPPGAAATLRVTLAKAGSYEVYCPIDGHKDKGMRAELVVGNVTGAPTVQETTRESGTTTRSGY